MTIDAFLYLRREDWERHREAGALTPDRTDPELPGSYLVGLPSPTHEGWVASGLLRHVEERNGNDVLVRFPVRSGVVRDAAPMALQPATAYDDLDALNRALRLRGDYVNSTTPLAAYTSDFDVPEIWCDHAVPLDEVTVIYQSSRNGG